MGYVQPFDVAATALYAILMGGILHRNFANYAMGLAHNVNAQTRRPTDDVGPCAGAPYWASANKAVVTYRSPVSAKSTTIILPEASAREATLSAA